MRRNKGGIPVIHIDDIKEYTFHYIVIGFAEIEGAFSRLIKAGISRERICAYSWNDYGFYGDNLMQNDVDREAEEYLNSSVFEDIFELSAKRYYLTNMNIPDSPIGISRDFVREQTLYLISKEIYRRNVPGSIAELGVYHGELSKILNGLFPDRELFLFDTFTGFLKDEVKSDSSILWENVDRFNENNEEIVLGKLPNPSMCKVKKGYFPDTFDIPDEVFALVSIDVDLFESTKNGLDIFYNRLSNGGYIIVHDYNNIVFNGARDAVRLFCDENGISFTPLADIAGSIVITKYR